jgi:hypothetical protein
VVTKGAAAGAVQAAVAAGATPLAAAGGVATKVLAAGIASGPAWPLVVGVGFLGLAVGGGIAWYRRSPDRTYAEAVGQGMSGGWIATGGTVLAVTVVSAAQSLPPITVVHKHEVPEKVCFICVCVVVCVFVYVFGSSLVVDEVL